MRPKNINIITIVRNQRYVGPTSSAQQNDFQAEVVKDLITFQTQWNSNIVGAFSTVTDGSLDKTISAIRDGLSGKTILVDPAASLAQDAGRYYYNVKARPFTVYEQFQNLYLELETQINTLNSTIISAGGSGLTAEQQTRIGINIFNSSATSSSSSLDGRTNSNTNNILQVAKDLYGPAYVTFSGNGTEVLTHSLRDMVGALLSLHEGTWNSDITLGHAFDAGDIVTGTLAQDRVGPSSGTVTNISDSYSGTPTHLVHDLNIIRTQIRNLKNAAASFNTALSLNANWNPVTVGLRPSDIKKLTDLKGSGTRSDTNPWGYAVANIEGLDAILTSERAYTGRISNTDNAPTYSDLFNFSQGDSLVTAIGALASGVNSIDSASVIAALNNHLNNLNNPHQTTLTLAALAGGLAPALQVSVVDAGSFWDENTVEAVLQEVGTDLGNLSSYIDSEVNNLEISVSGLVNTTSGVLATAISNLDVNLQTQIDNNDQDIIDLNQDITNIDNLLISASFRRLEVVIPSIADDASYTVSHNAGMYPQVQVITLTELTVPGHAAESLLPISISTGIEIVHSGVNNVIITNRLGESMPSGIMLINW